MPRVRRLRRALSDMAPPDAMEVLLDRLKLTRTNAEFLQRLSGA
jgi:transcription termination factor Rho